MKAISILHGFTNKREAIEFMSTLKGDLILAEVIHNGGLPVTPIAYFIIDQTMIDLIQETLNDELADKS
jgi:hypothetical protein